MSDYWQTELVWFAGIMDGEGCYNLVKQRKQYNPRLEIKNTNFEIIQRCERFFIYQNLAYSCSDGLRPDHPTWKPIQCISISENASLRKILRLLLPFVTRFTQCDLLLQFVEHRFSEGLRTPIGEFENSTYYILKQENKRGIR